MDDVRNASDAVLAAVVVGTACLACHEPCLQPAAASVVGWEALTICGSCASAFGAVTAVRPYADDSPALQEHQATLLLELTRRCAPGFATHAATRQRLTHADIAQTVANLAALAVIYYAHDALREAPTRCVDLRVLGTALVEHAGADEACVENILVMQKEGLCVSPAHSRYVAYVDRAGLISERSYYTGFYKWVLQADLVKPSAGHSEC